MSRYTTELRYICEHFSGLDESVGYYKVDEVISKCRDKIFGFEYPIFDENYREVLETKILKHYYTREIGYETTGLWLMKLNTKLNEIMPYYNKLYESELIEFNPFHDVNVTRKHSGKENDERNTSDTTSSSSSGNSTSNTTQNSNTTANEDSVRRDMYSDTPQGSLVNVENNEYLTNARKVMDNGSRTSETDYSSDTKGQSSNKGTVKNTNKQTYKSTDEYLETVVGKQGTGSFSSMLLKYRETFLNIDMMIIEELSELFMLLW